MFIGQGLKTLFLCHVFGGQSKKCLVKCSLYCWPAQGVRPTHSWRNLPMSHIPAHPRYTAHTKLSIKYQTHFKYPL